MSAKPIFKLDLPAQAHRLCDMRACLREALLSLGCAAQEACNVVLAVNEATTNVIQHGYRADPTGRIVLEVFVEGPILTVQLTDFAWPIPADRLQPRDLGEVRPGGLGLYFIQEIMDEVRLEKPPCHRGNCIVMRKRLSMRHGGRTETS